MLDATSMALDAKVTAATRINLAAAFISPRLRCSVLSESLVTPSFTAGPFLFNLA
jgi:hypothetical protein